MRKSMIKSILFDLDGTLVDSAEDILYAINFALANYNLKAISYDQCKAYLGDGIEDLLRRAIANTIDEPIDAQLLSNVMATYKETYANHLADRTHLYPGVQETLDKLQGYELAVISNKSHRFCISIVEKLGIVNYFRFIIGGDSLPFRKPDPGQIDYVRQQLNLRSSEILLVGDSENDILAGHAGGVPVVAVKYGYRNSEVLSRYQPEYMIDCFPELLKILV